MLAVSISVVLALKTTIWWVGEAIYGLINGGMEGIYGNDGQEGDDCAGPSGVDGKGDGRGKERKEPSEGGSEVEEDWDPEMVGGGLGFLSDAFTRTRGYLPCRLPSSEQSLRGYRIYFNDGSWVDVK